jgi:hypothetical protein
MRSPYAFVVLALALGCSSEKKFVPVSGRVTMNNQPLADALVSFRPVVPEGTLEAPESTGKTNENGEFSLKTVTGQDGAWVGKHVVRITLVKLIPGAQADSDARIGGRRPNPPVEELVPARYNTNSKEEFDVPSGGTNQANFSLTKP